MDNMTISPLPQPLVVAYGGGTNSTAMLCGFREIGIKPDLILFADTGAEQPHTYKHVEYMKVIVREWFGLEIQIVRHWKRGVFEGREGELQRLNNLPSLAYGMKSCSMKYKQEPQHNATRSFMRDVCVDRVTRAIGFDANESHRVRPSTQPWADNWFPLVEWGWRRQECLDAICRAGLPRPGKSSCYFCPAMKPSEVLNLKENHPDLAEKALAIERNAQPKHRKPIGLGGEGNFWSNWMAQDSAQMKLLDLQPMHTPCHCTDEGEP